MLKQITVTLTSDEVAEAVTDWLKKKKEILVSGKLKAGTFKMIPSGGATGTWENDLSKKGEDPKVGEIRAAIQNTSTSA